MKINNLSIFALASLVSINAYSNTSDEIDKDLESTSVVQKVVKSGDDSTNLYLYMRQGFGRKSNFLSPDYFFMWHGNNQTAYPFMNATGLMFNNADLNKPPAVFLSLDSNNFSESTSEKKYNMLNFFARSYKEKTGYRMQVSAGYDEGVADAYRFACKSSLDAVVISSGGLYANEACVAEGLSVFYTLSSRDQLYLYDEKNSFSSVEMNPEKLSGVNTIERLAEILSCKGPVESDAVGGKLLSYTCDHENSFSAYVADNNFHQWAGYTSIERGSYNMYGPEMSPTVSYWLYREIGVK